MEKTINELNLPSVNCFLWKTWACNLLIQCKMHAVKWIGRQPAPVFDRLSFPFAVKTCVSKRVGERLLADLFIENVPVKEILQTLKNFYYPESLFDVLKNAILFLNTFSIC